VSSMGGASVPNGIQSALGHQCLDQLYNRVQAGIQCANSGNCYGTILPHSMLLIGFFWHLRSAGATEAVYLSIHQALDGNVIKNLR